MWSKKTLFWITISLLVVFSGLVSYNFVSCWAAIAPIKTITLGRKMLLKAYQADAGIYAPALMSEAGILWKTLLERWHTENEKFLSERDYSDILKLSRDIIKISEKAVTSSQSIQDSLRKAIPPEQLKAQEMLKSFKTRYNDIALDRNISANLVKSELLVFESEYAYQRNDLLIAAEKVRQVYQLIGQSEDVMSQRLKEYFAQLPVWRSWVQNALNKSADDSALVIIVDKIDKKCRIYDTGELKFEFSAEFGLKWIGPKKIHGDYSTPEGHYQIRKKKEGKKTNFYLALEINYPNTADEIRFLKVKAQGEAPADAMIGGSIEIHGGGGEGENWTDGCIALINKDMDIVYRLAEVGTPVIIVGALQSNFIMFK